jgi:hypothetical protein
MQPAGHHAVNMPAAQPPLPPLPQQQQQQQQLGASMLAQSVLHASLAGSDFLPTNEREDLSSRIAASQSLLQSFYEAQVGWGTTGHNARWRSATNRVLQLLCMALQGCPTPALLSARHVNSNLLSI